MACLLFSLGHMLAWFQLNSQYIWDWWRDHPDDEIAIITGDLSGVVVVDCDNEEAAAAAAAGRCYTGSTWRSSRRGPSTGT